LFAGFLLVKRHFVSDLILIEVADILNGLLANTFCHDQFHVAEPLVGTKAFRLRYFAQAHDAVSRR